MRAILTERPRGDQAGGYSAPQASGVRFSSGQSSIGVMPDIMSPDDAMVQHTSSGSAGAGSAGVGSAGAAGTATRWSDPVVPSRRTESPVPSRCDPA
jgi:hypothetical protein